MLWFVGCKGFNRGQQLGDAVSSHSVQVRLSEKTVDSVRFYYSGCAGFFIRHGSDAILNDPFLSNNGPMTAIPFHRLVPDSVRLAAYTQHILDRPTDASGVIKMLTATHTHYDHVYDVPALYHHNLNRDSLLLVGSESFRRLMKASEGTYGD
jgi:L-ascorbate metabolism protein UlaG (beta-lactamase superfamily)